MQLAIRKIGLASILVLATGAFATSAAQATTGPSWIVGAAKTKLGAGQQRAIETLGETKPKLSNAVANIECESDTATGNIKGNAAGIEGSDEGTIIYKGCHVEGKPTCVATTAGAAAGEISAEVLTELVYETSSTTMALEAFYPKETNFASFVLTGTACGVLNGKTITVAAGGTAAPTGGPITAGKKCGVLAKVGKNLPFTLTTPGEVSAIGSLEAPATPITGAELVLNGTASAITCKLEANAVAAKQVQTDSVKINEAGHVGEEFGWTNS